MRDWAKQMVEKYESQSSLKDDTDSTVKQYAKDKGFGPEAHDEEEENPCANTKDDYMSNALIFFQVVVLNCISLPISLLVLITTSGYHNMSTIIAVFDYTNRTQLRKHGYKKTVRRGSTAC